MNAIHSVGLTMQGLFALNVNFIELICLSCLKGDSMKTNLLYILIPIPFLCVPSFAKDYIIGGQEVTKTDPIQRSTVGIFSPSPGSKSGSLCTATLIKNNIALTAAHCINPRASKPVVIFGPNLRAPEAIREKASAVKVYPKWNQSSKSGMDQGDIALVKFDGGIPSGYNKIATASSDRSIKTGGQVVLAGYGISNARTKEGAGRLRKTSVQIANSRPGKSEMILDQSKGRGACHGDSGGPAYIQRNGKMILAGITNRGYPNGSADDCAHQVVYTKVPAYRDWIAKNERLMGRPNSASPFQKRITPRRGKITKEAKLKRKSFPHHPRTSAFLSRTGHRRAKHKNIS